MKDRSFTFQCLTPDTERFFHECEDAGINSNVIGRLQWVLHFQTKLLGLRFVSQTPSLSKQIRLSQVREDTNQSQRELGFLFILVKTILATYIEQICDFCARHYSHVKKMVSSKALVINGASSEMVDLSWMHVFSS